MNILRSVQESELTDQMIVRECMRMFHEALGTIKARYSEEINPHSAHQAHIELKFGRGIRSFSLDSFVDGCKLRDKFQALLELIESQVPQVEEHRLLQLVTHPLPCSGNMQRCLFDGISLRIVSWEDGDFDKFRIEMLYSFEPLI